MKTFKQYIKEVVDKNELIDSLAEKSARNIRDWCYSEEKAPNQEDVNNVIILYENV